ncbi:S4 domain-containing protein YaaA [Paenisporosarcina sp. OV554]|uniref:S4 domain-containing protein YaaA n=1 Tax=Paenisporosarcina sp. OV554 TaxID=2135694 RepID=UPI000D3B2CC1|nr:S4 domain-containing protein YaaA [Paenisporosarcina sp. OV554]PUB11008.1 ribosome-associated protein [Paenisporosarcina sp. OV554]
MKNLQIGTEYVTLGQMLKMTDAISSGGMSKWFLSENEVLVNDEVEVRRGRKLRDGDLVSIPGVGQFRIVEQTSGQ